jgi:hypothetical protein
MKKSTNKGQTAVFMLMFVIIGVTISSAAIVLIGTNSTNVSMFQDSVAVYQAAEAGAENTMVRILRDPTYSGETISINGGVVTITVTGTDPKTIVSTALFHDYERKVQVIASDTNGLLRVSSWKEIF